MGFVFVLVVRVDNGEAWLGGGNGGLAAWQTANGSNGKGVAVKSARKYDLARIESVKGKVVVRQATAPVDYDQGVVVGGGLSVCLEA